MFAGKENEGAFPSRRRTVKKREKSIETMPVYCKCRSTETERMICCDTYSEWYHDSCIDVSSQFGLALTSFGPVMHALCNALCQLILLVALSVVYFHCFEVIPLQFG